MSPQIAPPFVSSHPFQAPRLVYTTTQSSSADDYRSVIDDLTIENKRLKEELKRYRQHASRDLLEKEKLFEIKVHGLTRRKKQELEATLRDFAASVDDSASGESVSQNKREKSASSRSRDQHHHHHHHHYHHHHPDQALQSSSGSHSKYASNSSSRSRPVDSAYASMSTGANSSGLSLTRPPFGGSKARVSSDLKVERYLKDIPQGLHPNFGLTTLGVKDKKKLIVKRLEQLFTGKINGHHARNRISASQKAAIPTQYDSAGVSGAPRNTAASSLDLGKSSSDSHSGSREGGAGVGNRSFATSNLLPAAPAPPALIAFPSQRAGSIALAREARIQTRHASSKHRSHGNKSPSNSNSNGDETGTTSESRSGSGNGNGGNNGGNSQVNPSSLPDQRPTRPLDLDPDRTQVPAENMEYIRHLGLVPPDVGPLSVASVADVSPDADGWVYLNLLSNLAQLHIFNVAPDFIRQALVEKSTKFQVSPDGQKIRWRGGTEGTKFSSEGSAGYHTQQSQSTDEAGGSEDIGRRKRAKMSLDGSTSALSSNKKQSNSRPQDGSASSDFHYKPLFFHRSVPPMPASEEESASADTDEASDSQAIASQHVTDKGIRNLKGKKKSNSNSGSLMYSNSGGPRYDMRSSGSSNASKKRKSDGVLVYYSGMPFCTDLAGEAGSEGLLATTDLTSSGQLQDSVDEPLQNRPTMHRTTSGSSIPFRPLTDYLTLSRDEWAGLGLLGIGTVGRAESTEVIGDTMSSSASSASSASVTEEYLDDDLTVLSRSSSTDALPVGEDELYLEACGIGRVFPEDHFMISVATKRTLNSEENVDVDDDDDDDHNNRDGPFSMSSLRKRLSALKKQIAPISAAVAVPGRTHSVLINYVSTIYHRLEPVELPQPSMFYQPFSDTSESEEDEAMLDSEVMDVEDDSILASSVVSQRANPHQSVDNASLASQDVMMSSGEEGDVEAEMSS